MAGATQAKRMVVVLAAFFALAGCAVAPSPRIEAQRPGCSATLVADAPFSIEEGKLLVSAIVNGVETRLAIDTGLTGVALSLNRSREVNRRLGVEMRASERKFRTASGAIVGADEGLVDEVRIGGAAQRRVVAQAPADPTHLAPEQPGDGVLGMSFLAAWDIEIDPRLQRLRLHEVTGCGDLIAPPFAVSAAIPLRRLLDGPVFAPIWFGERELQALLDTGSSLTLLTPAGAAKAGVSRAALAAAPRVGEITDDVGNACAVCSVDFARVMLGKTVFRDAPVLVVETTAPFDAFLGLDLLLAQRIWISFSTGWLHLGRRDF